MAALQSITLYEHVTDLVELLQESELAGPEHRAQFDELIQMQICGTREKIDRVSAALSQLEAVAQHATEEIERLQKRKASALQNAERLKAYVIDVMASRGLKKLEGNTSGFTLRCNAPGVDIVNPEAVPAEFIQVRESRQPDKRAIKDALAHGIDVPGVRLVQTLSLVRR